MLGPTTKTASISPDVNDPGFRNITFDELVAAYAEAIRGLVDGGVDLLLVETIFDTLNAKAAIFAIEQYFDEQGARLPVMISGTITDASGRTLSGQTTEAFWNSVRHARPLTIGLNCALGAKLMRPYVEELARVADTFVRAYPNAGLPNPLSDTGYDELPADTAALLEDFARSGLPQHRRRLLRHHAGAHQGDRRHRAQGAAARRAGDRAQAAPLGPRAAQHRRRLAVRERRRAHQRHRLEGVRAPDPRRQLRRGAVASRASRSRTARRSSTSTWTRRCSTRKQAMRTFLNLIAAEPDISRVPVMIDCSKWSVIEAGLKCVQGKCIVNSIS